MQIFKVISVLQATNNTETNKYLLLVGFFQLVFDSNINVLGGTEWRKLITFNCLRQTGIKMFLVSVVVLSTAVKRRGEREIFKVFHLCLWFHAAQRGLKEL